MASGLRPLEDGLRRKGTDHLSRRERQIMDILYARGAATAADIRADLPDPPSYSAVRSLLRILEEKGHATHEQDGPRYLFRPTVPRETARVSALRHVVETFFDGSAEGTVAALLDLESRKLSDEDYARLVEMIDRARREGS